MKVSNRIAFTCFIAALYCVACDLPHEPGPQPSNIIDTSFEPGLNILGIIRLDDQPGSSFFYIERAYRYQELDTLEWDESFITTIYDAKALVQGMADTTTYRFKYELDSLRGHIYVDVDHDFTPVAGEQYMLTITHPEFPTLTDTTIVPAQPSLVGDSIAVSGHTVSFHIQTTADTYLYDVYLISASDSIRYRFVNYEGDGELEIKFNTATGPTELIEIHIYAYDVNLAEYLTSVITLKPQTYLELMTTVTGGYGVFGSVSVFKMELSQ